MPDDEVDILLIEDSPDDAVFVLHALEEAGLGARFRRAQDGAEALALLFGPGRAAAAPVIHPKLILLGAKLPRVDGLELLRLLKANPQTRPIPVVVLSSSQEARDLAECYRIGVNGYMVKPADFDELKQRLQALGRYWLKCNQTPNP